MRHRPRSPTGFLCPATSRRLSVPIARFAKAFSWQVPRCGFARGVEGGARGRDPSHPSHSILTLRHPTRPTSTCPYRQVGQVGFRGRETLEAGPTRPDLSRPVRTGSVESRCAGREGRSKLREESASPGRRSDAVEGAAQPGCWGSDFVSRTDGRSSSRAKSHPADPIALKPVAWSDDRGSHHPAGCVILSDVIP